MSKANIPASIVALVTRLTEEYPNKATALSGKSDVEVREYIAKLELIEHIKQIVEKG